MRLLIVRHGKAAPRSEGGRDADRPLQTQGERQAAYLARRLGEHRPARVLASTARRARQTAEPIARAARAELLDDDRLLVDEPVGPLLGLLGELAPLPAAALVGHNPQLSRLIGVLLAGPTAAAAHLRTGEAYVLEVEPANPAASATLLERVRLEG